MKSLDLYHIFEDDESVDDVQTKGIRSELASILRMSISTFLENKPKEILKKYFKLYCSEIDLSLEFLGFLDGPSAKFRIDDTYYQVTFPDIISNSIKDDSEDNFHEFQTYWLSMRDSSLRSNSYPTSFLRAGIYKSLEKWITFYFPCTLIRLEGENKKGEPILVQEIGTCLGYIDSSLIENTLEDGKKLLWKRWHGSTQINNMVRRYSRFKGLETIQDTKVDSY